ncbi:hypothetical protein J789_3626 [Acinetobacter baumannii 44895_6]|nr:hypothetical protein ABTW07_1764 [Acinetobacter baumannii TCDC-AB0715]ELX07562.1 hypothetical protein ACINNAV57_1730 [Acinetobacter baumannii Naval-57]EXA69254.1 hypothetical protein J503_1178 [Acinetobacter baumannii 984213]EXA84723.1 hypothetical protein J517_3004 [Acinetobacter baumannii 118362]EXC19351.1 hypothetical protein J549_3732 [Acinetobacter baumannii 724909]EXC37423.1 hypothetical protein J455_3927 [Acinetobacter baumannii 17534]EXC78085.1 hypothetical protein J468_3844 [Acine
MRSLRTDCFLCSYKSKRSLGIPDTCDIRFLSSSQRFISRMANHLKYWLLDQPRSYASLATCSATGSDKCVGMHTVFFALGFCLVMVVPKLIFVHEVSYAIDDSGLAFSSSHSAVNFPPLLIASIWAYLVSPVYSVLGNTPRFSILLMAMYVRFSNAAALDRPPTASKAYLMGFKVKSPF